MASKEDLRAERLKKLEALKADGYSPYPSASHKTHELSEIAHGFKTLQETKVQVIVAGRIMSARGQGALIFMDLYDGTAKIQVVLKKDEGGEEAIAFYTKYVDVGDFIEVSGKLFVTKSEQESILGIQIGMLSKALLPLPDKYHGIQDEELRMRERYLDILTNNELRDVLIKKTKFWDFTRKYLKDNNFLEVETPSLEITTGGAEARPFATHHNDFDLDIFMRISVGELWQKRLMAAGFSRTFEIGRLYRNEGSSPDHVQEFTNFEMYAAYMDYTQGMDFVQSMITDLVKEVFGTTQFTSRGYSFDLGDTWEKIDYVEHVREKTGVDVLTASEEEMAATLDKLGVKYEGKNRERLTDTLWKYCRKQIAGPAFLINHPKLVSPLAKSLKAEPEKVERMQVIIAGTEAGNGFSELNDPVDQRERFEAQKKLIEAGDEEAMMPDWEFVEMLEHGMPPTFGFAYGERLFALLVDKPIREVQLFPLVKPKN